MTDTFATPPSLAKSPNKMDSASFCLISSAIYLFNDIRDIENDKLHPRKCLRPIAKGDLSPSIALFSSIALSIISLLIGFLISKIFLTIIIIYGLIQISYSVRLKKEPLFDIFVQILLDHFEN